MSSKKFRNRTFLSFKDDVPIAVTSGKNYCLKNLRPNTSYNIQIQYLTCHGDSVRSDPVVFHTDEECKQIWRKHKFTNFYFYLVPPPVNNLHVVRRTMTAARIGWEQPDLSVCNSFKGYQVYLSKTFILLLKIIRNIQFVFEK